MTSTKLALEFLVLTAARSGEVRDAVWDEIDLENRLWVIPAARMKAKRAHRVPLSAPALTILNEARAFGDGSKVVFPGTRYGVPLSDMTLSKLVKELGFDADVHGFRTSFRTWVGPAHRCLVPLTSFAEPLGAERGNQWFATTGDAPMFFAGIEVRGWLSVRKVKDGETTDDLFAFLTTAPNEEVGRVHPKAMPVILTQPDEWERWLSGPWELAAKLQRPLPDGALRLVARAV